MSSFQDFEILCSGGSGKSHWRFITLGRVWPDSETGFSIIDNTERSTWLGYLPIMGIKKKAKQAASKIHLHNPKFVAKDPTGKALPDEEQTMLIGTTPEGWRFRCPKCSTFFRCSNETMRRYAEAALALDVFEVDISTVTAA